MKGNLILVCLILTAVTVFAQPSTSVSQIPANVKSTFDRYYPNASNVSWEQEGGFFMPSFTTSNGITKLVIDLKGALIQTSVKILPSTLPATATSYISVNYSGQSVADAEQLTMFNHSTRYEAVVAGKDLIFDSNGNFIRISTSIIKQ
jgi:hypothetical protein